MSTADDQQGVNVTRVEWNALVIETIVLSGVVMAAVIVLGRRFAAAVPDALWFGIGFLAVPVVLWPVLSAIARNRTGRSPSAAKLFGLAVLASVIGALITYLMRVR